MRFIKKFESEETNKFTGPDGEFVPSTPRTKGTASIEYLEELCEWVYFHNNMTDEEKLKNIKDLEDIVRNNLAEFVSPGMQVNYTPTWSTRLEKDLGL